MGIVRKLYHTRLGKWLRTRPGHTVPGAVVRVAWQSGKALNGMTLRRKPDHRAHDRKQHATLTRFVQDTARAQNDTVRAQELGRNRS